MCGRLDRHSEISVIEKLFKIARLSIDDQPHYNIVPSQNIVVIRDSDKRELMQCLWEGISIMGKRCENGTHNDNCQGRKCRRQTSFENAFRNQRCLVVADGFYEWIFDGKVKQPVYIRLKSHTPMGFAGLYSVRRYPEGEDIYTCIIITTDANDVLGPIHDRMPAIIPKDKEDLWLDQKTT